MTLAVPDAVGAVRGFRVWGVTPDAGGWLLQSTAAGFPARMPVWKPLQRFSAQCLTVRRCGEAVPDPAHGCGIYALADLDDALRWAPQMGRVRAVIIGEVAGWGRVVETSRGWRAAYAYPQVFFTVLARRRRDRHLPAGLLDLLTARYLASA